MHPNLVVFKNRAEAEKWVKKSVFALATTQAVAVIVNNPTEVSPDGCSIYFVPYKE